MSIDLRLALHSQDREYPPGRLADVKRGKTSDPGYPQPQAAEVESARLLADDARQALLAVGLSDGDIDRLADDFIAEDRGEETERFIDWAVQVHRAAARRPAGLPRPGVDPRRLRIGRDAAAAGAAGAVGGPRPGDG